MIRFLFSLITALMIIGCDEFNYSAEDNPTISKDYLRVNDSILLSADGSQQILIVTANHDWSIATTAEWLTITPMSGKGSQQVNITATENTEGAERKATLTITSGTAPYLLVLVAQAASSSPTTEPDPDENKKEPGASDNLPPE